MHISSVLFRRVVVCITLALLCATASSAFAQEPRATPQSSPPIPESASEPQGFIAEPTLIERAVIFSDRHFGNGDMTNGFYIDFANMIPGAGWISGGPGYRHWYARDRVFVDTSAAISWRGYKTAQGRLELPRIAKSRLALGSQLKWHDFTHVDFFGEGPDTPEFNRSEYQLTSTNLVGYATLRPVESIAIGTELGVLKPSVSKTAFVVADQPTFVHSEVSVTADTRDFPNHPTRGALLRAAAADYSDRDAGIFSFRRYEGEAAGFLPLAGSRVVVALHGWLVASDTGDGRLVPFYLQPSLGGHNSLRSYANYRFHDRNMLVVNAETRIAMMTHVDAALFVDAGNVGARVSDLNLNKRSYGAGLRLHSRRQTFARLDVASGDEGWRFLFRLTDPLSLARLSRRAANVPFVP
jgi:hypothetical protein